MDLSEVRINIDRVDKEIRQLFIERMGLSEKVVSVKAKTDDKIYKPDREVEIIQKNSEGIDENILKEYRSFLKKIMDVSRKYQYGRMLEWKDCFPFSYSKIPMEQKKAVILTNEKELEAELPFSELIFADSYKDMEEKIRRQEAEQGILVEDGNLFHNKKIQDILLKNQWYINQQSVITKEKNEKTVTVFSDKLIVLPEHNRYCVVLNCENQQGGICAILSMIADYGVNVSNICSDKVKRQEKYEKVFYIELEGNLDTKINKSLIFHLSEETGYFQIAGSYFLKG